MRVSIQFSFFVASFPPRLLEGGEKNKTVLKYEFPPYFLSPLNLSSPGPGFPEQVEGMAPPKWGKVRISIQFSFFFDPVSPRSGKGGEKPQNPIWALVIAPFCEPPKFGELTFVFPHKNVGVGPSNFWR